MVMKKLNAKYTFQQFNSELNELYTRLKLENYNDGDIKKVFLPLLTKIDKLKSDKSNKLCYIFISVIALISFLYFLTYIDYVYWHISAISRIILIKILPYFDWRYLKNKHCLIEKIGSTSNKNLVFDFNCHLCEHLNKIDVYENIDEDLLIQRYIELDIPLILTKGLEHWPTNSSFIKDLIANDNFYNSYPCKVSTNLHKGIRSAGRILERVQLFNEFFLHFQNCELEAMKIFRQFTYRPSFLPPIYSPILYNWLIWNRDYNITQFKAIHLVEKLTVVGQLIGTINIQLIPNSNCIDTCPILDVQLNAGETLLFTGLWDMEYRPYEEGENMAVILEAKIKT